MMLRVQDTSGRGPYRPGFSKKWIDTFRSVQHPPIYEECPDFMSVVRDAHARGLHIGCAVNGMDALLSWFSPMELCRLHDFGFRIVDCSGCEVLIQTPTQAVIASQKPLKRLPSAIGLAA